MRLDSTLWKSVDLWIYELDFYCPQINYQCYYFYCILFPLAVAGVWEIVKLALYCATHDASSFSSLLLLLMMKIISPIVSLLFYSNVKCIVLFNVLFRLFICFAHLNATTLNWNWFVYFTCIANDVFTSNTHIIQAIFVSQSSAAPSVYRCVRNCQTNLYLDLSLTRWQWDLEY